MIYLDDFAGEGSSLIASVVLRDENDVIVTPDSLTWSLLNMDDSVINSREDIALTPASTTKVVMTGADLAIVTRSTNCNYREEKKLVLEGTYTSDLGTLSIREERHFFVEQVGAV